MEQRLKKTISLILMKNNKVKEKCGHVRKKTIAGQALSGPFVFQGVSVLLIFCAA